MSETKIFQTPLAVMADIHGNRWALEAVLQDIDKSVLGENGLVLSLQGGILLRRFAIGHSSLRNPWV